MDAIKQLESLIRARYPLVVVCSHEESRVVTKLTSIGSNLDRPVFAWSLASGFRSVSGSPIPAGEMGTPEALVKALKFVAAEDTSAIYAFCDIHAALADPVVLRALKETATILRARQGPDAPKVTIALVSHDLTVPPEVEKIAAVIDYPLPARGDLLDLLVKVPDQFTSGVDLDLVVEALTGLTESEATNALSRSLVTRGKLDPSLIREEKEQTIRKSGILEVIKVDRGMESVGGMKGLKSWLSRRRKAFSPEAEAFGLKTPKGILTVGIAGTGKSLISKVTGHSWSMPVLKLDMGKIFGGLVGSSEANMRRMIAVAEACAPCILWVDEIEKGMSSGGGDGGTSQRVLGSFLTWANDKTAPVFIVATANDVSRLPPELLRKGRFDETFFVDLPTNEERRQIFAIFLERYGQDLQAFDLAALADTAAKFSGAEIEAAVDSAMFAAFAGDGELTSDLILAEIKATTPLANTRQEDIKALQAWAKGRARAAGDTKPIGVGHNFEGIE